MVDTKEYKQIDLSQYDADYIGMVLNYYKVTATSDNIIKQLIYLYEKKQKNETKN